MDELDALRGMRTTLAEEEHPDRIAARIDWRTAPKPPPRRRRRFAIPLAGVVTAGAVAAAALILVPDDGSGGERGTTRAEPRNVLLVAASNAETAPTGKYWHSETVLGKIYGVGDSAADHYKIETRQRLIGWVGPDGRERTGHREERDRPLTAADERKWRAAGSPERVEVPNPDGNTPAHLRITDAGPGWLVPWEPYSGAFGLSVKDIKALPTDAGALQDVLLDLEGRWHAYTSDATGEQPIRALRGAARVRALTEVAATLLSTAPAPPKVRAAAFRMLATLPGVRAGGEATDRLGRTGTVVSLPLETTVPLGLYTAPKQLGTYKRQWIIDPDEGALLAIRDLVATPPKGSRKLPRGRVLKAEEMPDRFHKPGELAGYKLFAVAEWTDEPPPE